MGWIIIHDRHGALREVRRGLNNLSQRVMGSNTLVQAALPAILNDTPQRFFQDTITTLHVSSIRYTTVHVNSITTLHPIVNSITTLYLHVSYIITTLHVS